ncbi:hypothetical protein D9M68_478150 [compost metagenome]
MPADDVGLELKPKRFGRQVFDGTCLAIGAVVEQRVDASAGKRQHRVCQGGDGFRLGIVHQEGLDALSFKGLAVFFPAHGGKDTPAVGMERARTVGADPGRTSGDNDCGAISHPIDSCRNPASVSHIHRRDTIELRKPEPASVVAVGIV